jgi:hypothetical protein
MAKLIHHPKQSAGNVKITRKPTMKIYILGLERFRKKCQRFRKK